MVKSIHSSVLSLLEKHLGATTTSLAQKKARLAFVSFDISVEAKPSKFPYSFRTNDGIMLVNHANVFSRQKLDIGTRFFLPNIPDDIDQGHIIDLGCGNGALGTKAGQLNPKAKVTFVDESYMAIASAQESWSANNLNLEQARFTANDCLTGFEPNSADLILCNPPFHQGDTVGDHIAWRMFTQARSVLKPGGELRIIGNRHLGYHVKLKRLFGGCRIHASDPKFVILCSKKR